MTLLLLRNTAYFIAHPISRSIDWSGNAIKKHPIKTTLITLGVLSSIGYLNKDKLSTHYQNLKNFSLLNNENLTLSSIINAIENLFKTAKNVSDENPEPAPQGNPAGHPSGFQNTTLNSFFQNEPANAAHFTSNFLDQMSSRSAQTSEAEQNRAPAQEETQTTSIWPDWFKSPFSGWPFSDASKSTETQEPLNHEEASNDAPLAKNPESGLAEAQKPNRYGSTSSSPQISTSSDSASSQSGLAEAQKPTNRYESTSSSPQISTSSDSKNSQSGLAEAQKPTNRYNKDSEASSLVSSNQIVVPGLSVNITEGNELFDKNHE